MAKSSARRWRNWRVSSTGRTIRSNPKYDVAEKARRKAKKKKKRQPTKWYWMLAKFDCQCRECGRSLKTGLRVAFSYPAKAVLCPECAKSTGVAERCQETRALREANDRAELRLGQ